MQRWTFGRLIWVPGEHPAEKLLEAADVAVTPVGYRTREDVTSAAFCSAKSFRAVFRDRGWTFLIEPARVDGDYTTVDCLSAAFGEAHGLCIDELSAEGDGGTSVGGTRAGTVRVEHGAPPVVEGVLSLGEGPAVRDVLLPLLGATTLTLEALVFDGRREWRSASLDEEIAAVLDHDAVAEVFRVERSDA